MNEIAKYIDENGSITQTDLYRFEGRIVFFDVINTREKTTVKIVGNLHGLEQLLVEKGFEKVDGVWSKTLSSLSTLQFREFVQALPAKRIPRYNVSVYREIMLESKRIARNWDFVFDQFQRQLVHEAQIVGLIPTEVNAYSASSEHVKVQVANAIDAFEKKVKQGTYMYDENNTYVDTEG